MSRNIFNSSKKWFRSFESQWVDPVREKEPKSWWWTRTDPDDPDDPDDPGEQDLADTTLQSIRYLLEGLEKDSPKKNGQSRSKSKRDPHELDKILKTLA